MFEEDVKRINACLEHKDYYTAMEYAMLVKEKYKDEKNDYFDDIIKHIKIGDYKSIKIPQNK